MNGVVFTFGTRYWPSELDFAILADVGWPVAGVESVTINDGAAQRSRITSVTVVFN